MSEIDNKLIVIEKERDTVLSRCQEITVSDSVSERQAAEYLVAIRGQIKKIEVERKTWTDPLEQQKKRLIDVFKKLSQPLVEAENHIDSQMRSYRTKLEQARHKEELRLLSLQQKRDERAAAAGKPAPLPVSVTPFVGIDSPKTVQTETGKRVTYVDRWGARVVDIRKVPHIYLLPDMVSLNKLAQENRGENPPDGVVFEKEISTRAR